MLLVDNLEQLLIKNLASFVNLKPFTDYILSLAQGCEPQIIFSEKQYPSGAQFKVSQFKLIDRGFLVWVEFSIPKGADTLIGTSELILSNTAIEHLKTIGTLIKKT